ncbi:hypothetical protein CUJ84_Chr004371 [Rhizobium leguminosarum]|uniref:Uncharacterized protein n=1 Tax=Rhizobium leguminosarum TaxID=384 RepID=A0A2K9Z8U4_RHILE|nr:hypothetical protein CUJ84_Chr004371 [Rhizobium leguminosarum]
MSGHGPAMRSLRHGCLGISAHKNGTLLALLGVEPNMLGGSPRILTTGRWTSSRALRIG